MYKSDLIKDTKFFLFGSGYSDASHSSYSDAEILTRINQAIPKAFTIAIEAGKRWKLTEDYITSDIESGISTYTLSSSLPLYYLDRVEVNRGGTSGSYVKANIIQESNVNISIGTSGNYNENDIIIRGNDIVFLNTPTSDSTNGIKIYYQPTSSTLTLQQCTYSAVVEEAVDKELTISNVKDSTDESAVCASLIVTLEQNDSDTLEVTNPSATSLLIKLADTTASKNTLALIQTAIRTLDDTYDIDFSTALCTGSSWLNVTGDTLTSDTDTFESDRRDIAFLPDNCAQYLSSMAALDYCMANTLTEKNKNATSLVTLYANNISKYYVARLQQNVRKMKPKYYRYN